LVLALGGDEIHQARPVVYQTVNGVRRPVPGGYRLRDEHTVVFQPGAYDRSLPLTIDPRSPIPATSAATAPTSPGP